MSLIYYHLKNGPIYFRGDKFFFFQRSSENSPSFKLDIIMKHIMLRNTGLGILIWILSCICVANSSQVHDFYYKAEYTVANPDGVFSRKVISFNGTWPLPTIRVNKGDRVRFHLINGLDDGSTTSLHFHGLFMNGTNHMDGPVGVTQCPISPGEEMVYDFTVDRQSGTYWYHSHSGSQYSDGLRGLFIIHDEEVESNYEFDEELAWSISDWYHASSKELVQQQLTRYNPTGAEPIPQNALFNDSRNVTININYDTTYLIRIANIGIMVSQFFTIPGYDFDIVEVDGVYINPKTANMAYLTVGQRMSILLKTKSKLDVEENISIVTILDKSMLDVVPSDLELNSINHLVYNQDMPMPIPPAWIDDQDGFEPVDDLTFVPIHRQALLAEPDQKIELLLHMDNLGDGINYAFFNNHTYVSPKIPTLLTALSAPSMLKNDGRIYGSNTNSFVLNKGDIIEIVLNNEDDNKHPMHLHGHQFQVVARSDDYEEPVHYDPDNVNLPDFPAIRDTVYVGGNGYVVIRFVADNPGVWFFHCHLDFHLEQGLAITLIEAPNDIDISLPYDQIRSCNIANIPTKGNAAGNREDFLNLEGENIQPDPLPEGFTLKGYIALLICALTACYGLWSIYIFGMHDVTATEEDKIRNEWIVTSNYVNLFESLKNDASENDDDENFRLYDDLYRKAQALNSKLEQLQ